MVMIFAFACDCGKKGDEAAGTGDFSIALTSKATGDVLADVGGMKIYFDEYKERMEKQSPYIRSRYNTLEKKKEFLDNMVQFELLGIEALKRGYGSDPEVIRSAKQVMVQKLMREEFDNKVKKQDIPEEKLSAYYEANKADYSKPEMRRVAHILVKVPEGADEAAKKELRRKADQVLQEVKAEEKDPNSFRKLAKKYSDDESNKHRGGDLGYFARTEEGGPMEQAFSDAVYALTEVNAVSPVVETKFGFHVIRLTGERKKIERSFEDVKEQIRHRLYKEQRTEAFDDFVENLRKQAQVSIKEDLLNSYNIETATPQPGQPGMPPAQQEGTGIQLNRPEGAPQPPATAPAPEAAPAPAEQAPAPAPAKTE